MVFNSEMDYRGICCRRSTGKGRCRNVTLTCEGVTGIFKTNMENFDRLLEESVKTHGHLCPGQVLGVKMSILGLKEIGIEEPKGKDKKNIIVFVEMDRCATDAVQSVTGCSLGRRTMKFMDYGKMAATFLNLKKGMAVRVIAREDAREKAKEYFHDPESSSGQNKYKIQLEAYKVMSDEELFEIMSVDVEIRPEDMPGRPLGRIRCDSCGEYVQDMREVYREGKILCRPCADGGYYRTEGVSSCRIHEVKFTGE